MEFTKVVAERYSCKNFSTRKVEAEKLTEIIRSNDIKSVTVVRMEVPCCGGLEMAAKKALQQSGKFIPWQVVTITVDGRLVEE